jgi:hypothetical protein
LNADPVTAKAVKQNILKNNNYCNITTIESHEIARLSADPVPAKAAGKNYRLKMEGFIGC